MITDHDLGQLRVALKVLSEERTSCLPMAALESLSAFKSDRFVLTIDLRAAEALGAPLIVAQPLPAAASVLDRLSPRERDVAALLVRGLANKAIARDLAITVPTVKDHVHKILSKTGASSRSQFAAMLHAVPAA